MAEPDGYAQPESRWPALVAWGAVGAGAALLRLLLLDLRPLSEAEATRAFVAWQAAQGHLESSLTQTGEPLLAHLLSLLFWLFGGSDAVTRLVPVLAGVGLSLTPALLTPTVGARAALLAGILIATSPIAVEASRVADPAAITAALAMLIVAGCIRLFTDGPPWAPWTLAAGAGLAVVHESTIVVALAAAGVAALVTWTPSARQIGVWARRAVRAGTGPAVLGVGMALVAGTGGLMDLGGVGFPLGPLWGGAPGVLQPGPLPARNIVAILAYAGPLLALAVVGLAVSWRAGDRLGMFLGQWLLLLLALGAAFDPAGLTLALLPIAPAALLASLALARLPLDLRAYRLSGAALAAMAATGLAASMALVVTAQTVGTSQTAKPATLALAATVLVLVAVLWAARVPRAERGPSLVLLGVAAFAALTLGSVGRLSYGGSPPGTELLDREETDPAFRAAFRELIILANGDPARALVYDSGTPMVARWYGRLIPQVPLLASAERRPIAFREAPPPANAQVPEGERTPWKVVSQIERSQVGLMSVASWAISRARLVDGKPRDIIIIR